MHSDPPNSLAFSAAPIGDSKQYNSCWLFLIGAFRSTTGYIFRRFFSIIKLTFYFLKSLSRQLFHYVSLYLCFSMQKFGIFATWYIMYLGVIFFVTQRYMIMMKFVEDFEECCTSFESFQRLRSHHNYQAFMTKWSLPVYFQIR